jgi:hypothetical protein
VAQRTVRAQLTADPQDLVLPPAQLPGGDATSDADAMWAIVRIALVRHSSRCPTTQRATEQSISRSCVPIDSRP